MAHVYVGVEIVIMTAVNRATLVAALKRLGRQADPQPCRVLHYRTRLDNLAVLLEAEFDNPEDVSVAGMARRLEEMYGLAAGSVTYTTASTAYGNMVTFKTGSTSRLRMIVFGGVEASWGESLAAVTAYLKANQASWETAQ